MSEQAGRYQRSFSGMIGAMVVLLLVIGAFVAFRALNRTDPADPVKAVDYKSPLRFAREEARFPVLGPPQLPAGWIATSVRFENGEEQSWHLGMLTGDREYVGLEQSADTASTMVEEFVDDAAVHGNQVSVNGTSWDTWSSSDGDRALVREAGDVTTLVVGTVPEATLEKFVTTLR